MASQVIDKGRIVAAVDKYPEKVNGQPVLDNFNQPKFKNKWMAIGESTKWRNEDGSEHVTEKIYLQPVNVNGPYFEQRTFWDSQSTQATAQQNAHQQQAAQQQSGGFQQQPAHQQGGGFQQQTAPHNQPKGNQY